ncbi:MAG: class I tRNA ligase family protein [Planctomycetota bacterium]
MKTEPKATELPPMYDPTQVEPAVLKQYLESNAYAASPDSDGEPYSIVIPPPNVTAALHLGHALNNTLQDVLTRVHRMRGFNTLWMPGTDHAGIATQTVVDKRLQQEGKPALKEYKQQELNGDNGRGQFINQVTAWKDEYEQTITNQLKEMGCSCDWDRQRFTMDDQCAKAVREAFFQLFKDGLIYRGKRLVNWDPVSQTALADDEVEMQDIDGNFYYMKYPVCDADGNETGAFTTVATTRPETMLGDTAVAVNPGDEPRAKYIGQYVKLPIVNRVIPIIGDDYVVIPDPDSDDGKAKMASGFLKVTPAHDPNDYEIGTRHDLAIINVMAPDASVSIDHGWPADENAGSNEDLKPFIGLAREDARKAIVKWFKANDLMAEVKPYRHAVGHSYRSHVPIEPYYTDQWYVKVTDDRLRGAALRAMAKEQYVPSSEGGVGILPAVGPKDQIPAITPLQTRKRRLPHWELGGSTYFITFRIEQGELQDEEKQIVIDACKHWHNQRLDLHQMVVMPDHVHLLITPLRDQNSDWYKLADLMHSIKSFSATEINKQRGGSGKLWQQEYHDRIVRDEDELLEKWDYIINNPVKAGLVERPEDYAFYGRGDSAVPADGGQDAHPTDSLASASGRVGFQPATGDHGLTFTPERYAKTFQAWHENIRDWCISRQLWWGHRIPVWSGPASCYGFTNEAFFENWLKARTTSGLTVQGVEIPLWFEKVAGQWQMYVCIPPGHEILEHHFESEGLEQDPDVLDTWFSSALWPLSTLGWPGETDELAKWNPTSVLCTAREIITLWVSRMVMFNRYFKGGDLPFNDVFIHAMIQDGHGQKMSKSLGNGVDPMDIIHSHGADAMRYVLTKMTTQTQDVRLPVDMVAPRSGETFTPQYITGPGGVKVAAPIQEHDGEKMVSSYGVASGKEKTTDDTPLARNTSEKFDEGQKFANKLWNAFRFALGSLGALGETTEHFSLENSNATLADRWILHRLGRTVDTVDKALAEYRFSDYAAALYDFVWRDLCDWYIEIVKRSLSETPNQQRVLVTCLDASLRLMHPVMPFITERLWQALNEQVPTEWRGVTGLELEPSEMLIKADWPKAGGTLIDASAEEQFEKLRSIVEAVRNARSAYKIPPRQQVQATTKAPGPMSQLIFETRYLTGPLTNCKGCGVGPHIDRPAGSAAVLLGDVTVYLHDVVDVETEKARLEKLLADKQKQVKTFEGRLSNKKYVDNAPAHLVQETKNQHVAAVKELEQVQQQLDELG